MSNSISQGWELAWGMAKDSCSGSRETGIPRSHHMPKERPPIARAKRVALRVGSLESVRGVGT